MSHYIPGAFAEEVTEEQATEQSTETSSTETKTEAKEETTEEKSTTEEKKETTEEKITTESNQKTEENKKETKKSKNQIKTQASDSEERTFYIDKGKITFSKDQVTGYVKTADGEYKSVSVPHTEDEYIITQADNSAKTTNNVMFEGEQTIPYNIKIKDVYMGQTNTSTAEPGKGDSASDEGMFLIPANTTKKINLYISGENIIKGIQYYVGSEYEESKWNNNSYLNIDSADESGSEEGKLYIPEKVESSGINDFVKSKKNYNHWNAGIGGTDALSVVKGLTIKGGTIQVLTTLGDNCSAIGGGGNGYTQIDITGGKITAVNNGTGATIGGGIGYNASGGKAQVNISGGNVYAENYGKLESENLTVGGVAIGGGSSFQKDGSSADISISGGTVQAYALYGNGIGSGNSAKKSAEDATIKISGGSIETNAIGGGSSETAIGGNADIEVTGGQTTCKEYKATKRFNTENNTNYIGSFGIGGGTSKKGNGGDAILSVKDGELDCGNGSIGGGTSKSEGNGGNATVNVTNGILKAGKIGGGVAEGSNSDNNGGDASIYVTGGTLDCISIGGGDSDTGTPGAVNSTTNGAGVVITGGTVKAGFIGGGKNNKNEVGFATANISGGDIQGQFILANTDSDKQCTFKMSGGTIDNTHLGEGNYKKAQENGGAVYLSDPNGLVEISGGTIQNSKAPLGGAVYMTAGEFKLLGNGKIQDCEATTDNNGEGYGGAVYLEEGTVIIEGGFIGTEKSHPNKAVKGAGVYQKAGIMNVTGGNISYNVASQDGGGVYLAGGQLDVKGGTFASNEAANGAGTYVSGGTLNISGGTLESNKATNGAGSYVSNGTLNISGGTITTNTADNGAGSYVSGGNLNISGGNLISNTATNGGGFYLAGGQLKILDGSVTNNTATNGAGMYVSDSTVRMFGGSIESNTAANDGGGMYVSSDQQAADVVVRSGKISNNQAGTTSTKKGNGGAIAVVSKNSSMADHIIIGLCLDHNIQNAKREFDEFPYADDADGNESHTHKACPQMKENQAEGNGGGIYMGSSNAVLDIYCLDEDNNISKTDSSGGSVMAEGGTVNIGDKDNNSAAARGNTSIKSSMLVKGGTVEISGNMENPYFADEILVDIKDGAGTFIDHRVPLNNDQIGKEYKVHYYENFERSGRYKAKQYTANETITAEGTMYTHEGYRIVEWNTDPNGEGTSYKIGAEIASKDDHLAWNGKQDNEALILYAIWEKVSYTVEYHPNADSYSGTMEDQVFKYGEEEPLRTNQFKVTGKRFDKWKDNKTGIEYAADYKESKMTLEHGATIDLYAQWVDCTHNTGEHPGTVTYTRDDTQHKITENCDCGYTASVIISASDVYYDTKGHPASLSYKEKLLAGNPTIHYKKKEDSGENYTAITEIPTQIGFYEASITVGDKTVSVRYQIKSPAEDTMIEAKAAKGQHFEEFTEESNCQIAKDDAFTIQFDIQQLNKNASEGARYSNAPQLTFSENLPEKTTIIMQTGNDYWYYKVSSNDKNKLELSKFVQMGDAANKFTYNVNATQQYRFIIDFSKVTASNQLTNELSITLSYKNESDTVIDITKTGKVSFEDAASFTVSSSNETLSVTEAPANDNYTRWNDKTLLWKISASNDSTKLPADAKLTVTTTVDGNSQKDLYQLNQKGEFIVPFTWSQKKGFQLSLDSDLADVKGKTYQLNAELFVGSGMKDEFNKLPEAAEDNGAVAKTTVNTTIKEDKFPAVKITGDNRIVTLGTDNVLNLNVQYENMDGYTLRATIEKKTDSSYGGNFLEQSNITKGNNTFTLGAITTTGSYRLIIIVAKDNQTIMTVPYYFIVK